MEKLKNYYKLCAINAIKQNIISNIKPEYIHVIFTNKQINLYLKNENAFEIKETVIGGYKKQKILIF